MAQEALVLLLVLLQLAWTMVGADEGIKLTMRVDAYDQGRNIPPNLFGIFFEEINHAGSGGLWAELVNNRGFEAGGQNTPSNIAPWYPVGNESLIWLESDRSSCFERNPIALRMEVLGDHEDGVGVANPGFWGMDIQIGQRYEIVFWTRSTDEAELLVSFVSENGLNLAKSSIFVRSSDWHKKKLVLQAQGSSHNAHLAITMSKRGVLWLDQVSAMPVETYKGHGFRKELAVMLEDLKPGFLRFPGGCYVEGDRLQNAWRWRDTIGPWERRPGHMGDKWGYWSDDGIGFFELLQLAEDLNAAPVWVFNNGISHTDEVEPSLLGPFVEDILDGIEFARGSSSSKWGRVRAKMGHPEPFKLHQVAIGNEDCGRMYYQANYLIFYRAIKDAYPDIDLISNCDGTSKPLEHPADLYDFHIYASAYQLFSMVHKFNYVSRNGPKIFVSEYAVTTDAGRGNLLAALAEACFLIGIEQNSDVVQMASYAPLFVNDHDRRWNPDAIVFNSWQQFGTPSYWVQRFFASSNGGKLLPVSLESYNASAVPVVVSALRTQEGDHMVLKAVNFGENPIQLQIVVNGADFENGFGSTISVFSADHVMDENSFDYPQKVVPTRSLWARTAKEDMKIMLAPYSMVGLHLKLKTSIAYQ